VGAGAPANKGAGVILNGGTVAVGTLDFGTQQGFVYTGEAGGEISSTVQGTSANYFGPGNVVLSGASVYAGETNVLSGTTMLAESGSITASSRVTVEYGATFNHQGTVGTSSQNVPLTIYGTRTGTGEIYGNVTVASSGLFAGSGTVYGNTTVEGVLSNASTDPSQIMTFDGDVTIKNEGDYYWSLTNTSDLSLNPYIVVDGTLTFESGAQLSLLFNSATDPAVGGAFWSTDQTFVLARAESIDNGEDGDNLSLNAMEYGNSYFYFHIGEAEGMEQLTLHWHAAVPEPSTWALLGLGALAGAVALRRRRRTS
jgi:autotransporter-associated beta strand protein